MTKRLLDEEIVAAARGSFRQGDNGGMAMILANVVSKYAARRVCEFCDKSLESPRCK